MLDIWDEMISMERRVDDLFRALLGSKARTAFPALPQGLHRPFAPASDVFARNGDLVIDLELPGVDPAKDVTVSIEDGDLVVRGERKQTKEVKEEDYYRMETSFGSFERHLPVPEGTKEEDVKAEYKNGVLEIVLPSGAKKIEKPKAKIKAIPIKTGTKK